MIQFPRAARLWPGSGLRRASVNSFGFGGTNSHIVMDDAFHYLQARGLLAGHCTQVSPDLGLSHAPSYSVRQSLEDSVICDLPIERPSRLFVWSGFDEESLIRTIQTHSDWLKRERYKNRATEDQVYLDSLMHTLSQRRSMFPWRTFCVADSTRSLAQQLAAPKAAVQTRSDPKIGFIFTGQGAQWLGMGKELAMFPVFMDSIQDAEKFLESIGCLWKVTGELTIAVLGHIPWLRIALSAVLG